MKTINSQLGYLWRTSKKFFEVSLMLILINSVVLSQVNLRGYSRLAVALSQLTSEPVVLLQPGSFLDPVSDPANRDQAFANAAEFNRLLKPSLIFSPTEKDLGQIFSGILTEETWALLPLVQIQVNQLEELRRRLFKADGSFTVGYKRYLDRKKEFEEIQKIIETTPENQQTPALKARFQEAEAALILAGQARYESEESRYQQLTELGSLKWRDLAIENLNKFQGVSTNGTQFLFTDSSPFRNDIDDHKWISLTITASQLKNSEPTARFASALAQTPVLWWYWSAPSDVDTSNCADDIGGADFSITCELAIAPIKRDWLDPKVFDSQAWRWKSGSNELLSDGNEENNRGTAPLFPESVIIVKSLTVAGPTIIRCLPYIRKAISNHHELGFGPFRLAGATQSTSPTYMPPVLSRASVHVVYPQVVGYSVKMLPKTPNSNPDFQWPN